MTGHLDLDALADAVAGEGDEQARGHLASCAECQAAVLEVQAASEQVSGELAALPDLPMPEDVVRRLAAPTTSVTTLPATRPGAQGSRWQRLLPAAAAVVLLIAGAGYALSRLGGSGTGDSAGSNAATSGKAAPTAGFPQSSTGTNYTGRTDLAAAAPRLLTGTTTFRGALPQAGASTAQDGLSADALARLRTPAGLADCLLALLPPDDPSVRPLALDYASFRGKPAMVVLLPAVDPSKLDVYVVGPGCSRANDSTLFYTSVARP